jgi:fumarylacetoacetase
MTSQTDDTHDPKLLSWVASANTPDTDFPIQNLPFGVFRREGADEEPRVGVAIGDQIVDIAACRDQGFFKGKAFTAALSCEVASLNPLMALGSGFWAPLRKRLIELLRSDGPDADRLQVSGSQCLTAMNNAELLIPVHIGNYTDFHASVIDATSVGSMSRPDNPLLPNYKYLPVAYHGRASSVQVSGTPVRRPLGQAQDDRSETPTFGASRLLDYELEIGFFVGPGNVHGEPVGIEHAEDHIFGLCLVNDWSARDIQKWECQPLGPFLAKSFATTISPWVVTLDALAPFRVAEFKRPEGDPNPLAHLDSPQNHETSAIDIELDVFLLTSRMRDSGEAPKRISRGNFRDMYWTIAQMLTHHTSNGCNLIAGDLLASGTVSGESGDSGGSLLEITGRGETPVELPTGEIRRFLEDGDEIIMTGFCERDGFRRIGFGECRGVVTAAPRISREIDNGE